MRGHSVMWRCIISGTAVWCYQPSCVRLHCSYHTTFCPNIFSVRNHTSRPVLTTACWGCVSFHPGVKGCADLEQGHSQLSGAVEEGKLAVVFALGPAPRGCADPVPLNKAKLMSYTCVAIVFAAVFVVNTLAAAIMSGVLSMGAKKTALTEQPQHSRGCQVEKPCDAGKQSKCLSPLQVCDLHSLTTMKTHRTLWLSDERGKYKCKWQVLGFGYIVF